MDRYMKAATFGHPDQIPVSIGLLPATKKRHGNALNELIKRYPTIFPERQEFDPLNIAYPPTYRAGRHVDVWGCVWENIQDGYEAIVVEHPVKTREDVRSLKVPQEDAGLPHGFLFLRLMDLRGFEEIMVDFAEEPPELQMLLDKVMEYTMRQLDRILPKREGSVFYLGDDNGTQKALPISPTAWRKYIKPCYQRIYARVHEANKLVYMHTDGCIFEVIPDFIEAGVDIINPQIRANGLDKLVQTCKGKVCVDLDLDRQLFPFATPRQIDEHIMECVEALYLPEGGLMLKAECGGELSLDTIDAICESLVKASLYRK